MGGTGITGPPAPPACDEVTRSCVNRRRSALLLRYARGAGGLESGTPEIQAHLPSHPNRLHRSLPTAEQDAERPAWRRSAPPRGRGRERCGLIADV
jgi:hypothetical protein